MEFKYTICNYPDEELFLKIKIDETEFVGVDYHNKAQVTPYYRNDSTGQKLVKGRKCHKTIFSSTFGRKSIMWNGYPVHLDQPDIAKRKEIELGKIYKMDDSVILATLVINRKTLSSPECCLVKDCAISNGTKIAYERILFTAQDCRQGYNGEIILTGKSRCIGGISYTIKITPEYLLQAIRSGEYIICTEQTIPKRKLKKYSMNSILGKLFG